MADEEQPVVIRVMRGVDLNVNSRLAGGETWLATQNMYARIKGILEARPGSKLISKTILPMLQWGTQAPAVPNPVQKIVVAGQKLQLSPPPYSFSGAHTPPSTKSYVVTSAPEPAHVPVPIYVRQGAPGWPGATQAVAPGTEISVTAGGNPGSLWKATQTGTQNTGGSQPTWPAAPTYGTTQGDGSVIWTFQGWFNPNSMRVAALARQIFAWSGVSYWFGAMAGGLNDFLFYLNASNQMVPIPGNTANGPPIINSHDGQWQMVTLEQTTDFNLSSDQLHRVLCVNGVDQPIVIVPNCTQNGNTTLDPTNPFSLQYATFTQTGVLGGYVYTSPLCVANVAGQLIFGGGVLSGGSNGDVRRFDHFAFFCDPQNPVVAGGSSSSNSPFQFAVDNVTTPTTLLNLQVGDMPSEPVVAISGSPAVTDGFGILGQTIFWTWYKTLVYSGPLPTSGNPAPPGFGQVAAGDVGTMSPKSIARTLYGTVFLGSDGLVYLVGLDNRIKIISRALEPILGGASQQFLKEVTGYYFKGFYHLFFPLSENGGAPTQEWVADLRTMNFWGLQSGLAGTTAAIQTGMDSGVEWFGPWFGRWVNCVGIARDVNSVHGTVYAGLGHLPAIIQLELNGSFLDKNEATGTYTDPSMYDLTTLVTPSYFIQTAPMDLGDAHFDKTVTAFLLGVGCQNQVSVAATLAIHSDVAGNAALSFTKTKTINPPTNGLTGGAGGWQLGSSVLGDVNNFALPAWQPSSVMCGRAFALAATITPTNPTFFRLSDLEFRVRPKVRRPTDL